MAILKLWHLTLNTHLHFIQAHKYHVLLIMTGIMEFLFLLLYNENGRF